MNLGTTSVTTGFTVLLRDFVYPYYCEVGNRKGRMWQRTKGKRLAMVKAVCGGGQRED